MPGTRIGRATMAEVPRVAEIIELCKQQMHASGSDQWDEIYPTEAVVAADARADSLFTGWLDGLCAAAVCLNEQQAAEYAGLNWRDSGGRPLVIHRLCVDPALQNRGIAARLMDFAEDFARQNSYTSIRLDTYTGNPRALALYERRGYTRTGQIRFPRRRMMFDCFEKMQSV